MRENNFFIETFPVGPLQCNCTILACERTGEAVVVDPGDDAEEIVQKIKERGFTVKALLHTHAHFDHILGTADVQQAVSGDILLHKDDLFLYEALPQQAQLIGLHIQALKSNTPPAPVKAYIEDGDPLDFIQWGGKVIHTPGHTPGSVCFYFPQLNVLFSGDTLFFGSIGRTDLPGGDFRQIMASIKEKLLVLPEETKVIPGHGPTTMLGKEKRTNPFVLEYT